MPNVQPSWAEPFMMLPQEPLSLGSHHSWSACLLTWLQKVWDRTGWWDGVRLGKTWYKLRQEKLGALTESGVLLWAISWGSGKHWGKLGAQRWSCQGWSLLTVVSYSHYPVFPRLKALLFFFCMLIMISSLYMPQILTTTLKNWILRLACS